MSVIERLRKLEKELKAVNNGEWLTAIIDGAYRDISLSKALDIVRDSQFLNTHNVHFTDGSGAIADLLNGLIDNTEGE